MENLVEISNVVKEYPGVIALNGVNFNIKRGEVHAIVGENGAGKSTLIKVITGAISPTSGDVIFDGVPLRVKSAKETIELGIAAVYQEFTLFPNLTVYENIFFGSEIMSKSLLNRERMKEKSKKVLDELGINIDVETPVKELTTAYQQIVEIARCLVREVKLIIMDEPSAPLTENEVKDMLNIVKRLNNKGVTIIYISHKLDEVFEISNRITVLRDGQFIKTVSTDGYTEDLLVRDMVGRELNDIYPSKREAIGPAKLVCDNLTGGKVKGASFVLHEGEVLGFGGLVGSGRTEVMRLLFGADRKTDGVITLNNKTLEINNPRDAIRNGIGLVPEDRKQQGLVLNKDILFNSILPNLPLYTLDNKGLLNFKKAKLDVQLACESMRVKMVSVSQITENLSGGNQQKIVIAKWLLNDCDILILDEPTRGIDVGAKQEIYALINDLALKGKSIIVVSSEMPELIGLSDRIIVMSEGKITGELSGVDMTQERILSLASLD